MTFIPQKGSKTKILIGVFKTVGKAFWDQKAFVGSFGTLQTSAVKGVFQARTFAQFFR